ncbi:MAG TPA: S8 family serine peptidase, partial [Verrucomicrobiae bacterium]|nr:S8 family serine peptidase [Verrucomicrobiae bacterium]
MRTRLWALGLLCLLCGVGAWFLWHHGNRSPAQKQNVAPTVAATRPVPAAPVVASRGIVNTNPAQISLAEWNTNRFAGRLSNTTRAIGQLVGDRHAILLANALIDTSLPLSFAFPKNLQPQGDPGAYIVQARGPIDNAFRAMLAQAGATVIAYIPNDAYLVRASASVAGLLGGNPQTQAVVPYEPYYKIQSPLLPQAVRQMNLPDKTILNLGLFADDAPATTQQIEKLGGQVVGRDQSPFGPIVRVIPPGNWTALATLSGVQIVEPYHPRAVATDLSRSTVGVAADSVTATNYMNLTGSNVLVEVNDTGIDALHPDLTASAQYGRAVGVIGDAPQSLVDTNGHGTHVAGIIAGDGTESTTVTNAPGSTLFNGAGTNFQFRGMAPGATLYSVGGIEGGSDTNIISDQYFQEVPALTNALISNNSWVYEGVSAYDLAAASYDAAVRDALPFVTGSQPVLFVFAAGNAGNGGDDTDFGGGIADSIESPATAKDVITVGALQEQRNITNVVTTITANADGTLSTNTSQPWKLMTSTSYRVAGFSSRGNVGIGLEGTFGRYKPDVVAPGTFIISTRSEQWDIGTYFYQSPTNDQIQTFSDLIVQPGSVFSSPFPSAPTNAVQLVIDVFPNARSPFPFPNLPIYVGLFTSPTVYDFVGANDPLFIPGDPNAPAGYLQQIFNSEGFLGAFNYAVSNNTANPISFDVLTDVITTNSTGDFFLVLSNLNLDIGKPNPASTGPGPYYRYETGTSMATPAVSGTLALMQEFYASAYGTLPSPAMLKAMLVNGARATGFYNYQAQNTINYEGWGLINLPDSLQAGITNQLNVACSTFIQDQNPTNALATGDSQTYFVATTNA